MKLPHRFALLPIALAGALALSGCVERKITIGSDPTGALVMLNDEEVGRTPVTVPFTWYGDYDVTLRLEKNVGTAAKPEIKRYYLHTHKRASAPPYQWVGPDLIAELLPIPFKDEKVWAFTVPEVREPTDAELIERARALKGSLDQPEPLRNKKKVPATTRPSQ